LKELRIYVSLQTEKEKMNMKTTRKLIQALDYIAYHQHNRTVGFMKAYKLLWLIDRYSMRHYARTVTGDMYFAMEHGTVPTDAKHVLENQPTIMVNSSDDVDTYLRINDIDHRFKSRKAPNLDVFSKSDINAMDIILEHYGNMSAIELSQLSHKFPEWLAYKDKIQNDKEKSSYQIDPNLFFSVYDDGHGVFNDDPKRLEVAKDLWNEYNAELVRA
jgi:uncharacterized phage-associated protein